MLFIKFKKEQFERNEEKEEGGREKIFMLAFPYALILT